jgi:long-chain acyl-CoA synthetase
LTLITQLYSLQQPSRQVIGERKMESIYQVFEDSAKKASNLRSLVYLGKDYTYAQLLDTVERVASALTELGVRKGQKVLLFMPNCPQWVIAWLALQKIGAVVIPITPYYGPTDLEYIANDSGAETIFCLDTNFGYVLRVLSATKLKRVIVTSMVEALPPWKQILGRLLNKVPAGKVHLDTNTVWFGQLMQHRDRTCAQCEPTGGDEIAEILYTGGTTGYPKGVPISHTYFLESMHAHRRNSEAVIPLGQDVLIQGAPLYHILGQILGVGALLYGEQAVLLPRINLDAMFDHIQRYKVTTLFGVPSMFRMILDHERLAQYDLGSLKYCFSGGDVLPNEVARRWRELFGKPIYQGYGTTETCGGIAMTPSGQPFPEGTVGKVAQHQHILIVNPESLEPVTSGEPGEVLVSSQHMMNAYWNKPEETARHLVQHNGFCWYRTGDIARLDSNGWLFFQDRSVDVIKHKGYRVAASRVEHALHEHPAVITSCVVGIPDPSVGERIKAFVVLNEDVKGVTAYDLTEWCRERLAPYEVPQYIEFRDMLPKSKVGKLLRRELRAEEQRKQETVS